MSGGHFHYDQYKIAQIADDIEGLIDSNDSDELNEWGYERGRHYSAETIERFKDAVAVLRRAYVYAQRVDWLVSDDDGEDSFHRRLAEELSALEGEK